MSDDFTIEEGRGNVFADLGLPDAEERLTKADLAIQIASSIRAQKLTQAKAAILFAIDQPKVSRLLRGQLSGFSTEKLIHFLTLLGRDVVIVVKPADPQSHKLGHVSVVTDAKPQLSIPVPV
jgi:predicted XRE-type DNA-binding protein